MELVDFSKAEETRVPELEGYISAIRSKVFNHAIESGDASVDVYLLALENDGALDIIERGLQAFPDNARLWVAYLERLDGEIDIHARFEMAVESVENSGRAEVLALYAGYLVKQGDVAGSTNVAGSTTVSDAFIVCVLARL